MTEFKLDGVHNILGKEEKAGFQHFLFFQRCFQKAFALESY